MLADKGNQHKNCDSDSGGDFFIRALLARQSTNGRRGRGPSFLRKNTINEHAGQGFDLFARIRTDLCPGEMGFHLRMG